MSIRIPNKQVLDFDDAGDVGAGSILGGVAKQFYLPQDCDNVVVKLTASIVGGGVSATFQTSDDGGTTWYDVQRTSIVSNTSGEALAEFLSISTVNPGVRTGNVIASVVAAGSVVSFGSIGTAIGSSGASTLSQKEVSGLPVMGLLNRVFFRYTAAVSANALARVRVMAQNQSNPR